MFVRIIYKHINRYNGKQYVGYTPRNPTEIHDTLTISDLNSHAEMLMNVRWRLHLKSVRHGSTLAFHNAIRKYGEGAFNHEVLEVCKTIDASLDFTFNREQFWVAYFHTDTKLGYNLTSGGNKLSLTGKAKHVKRTQTSKAKAARKKSCKRWWTPKRKLEASIRMKQIQARPEVKAKKRIASKITALNRAKLTRKSVEQLERTTRCLIATFSSASEADRVTGVSQGNINACANGKRSHAGGFMWRYVKH